jgi:hypothetical protein
MDEEDLKRNIRESLVYATLQIQGRNKEMYRRLVITEFYHSLNRKDILLNYETEEEVKKALEQLEALSYKP